MRSNRESVPSEKDRRATSAFVLVTALFAIDNEGEPRPRGDDTLRSEILQGLQYAWETPLVVLILTYMLATSLFVVNFGVGFGATEAGNRLVYKMRIGYLFGKKH